MDMFRVVALIFDVCILKVKDMRRYFVATLLGIALACNVGCFLPAYDADPAVRAEQLLNQSEDLRNLRKEWQRFWFLDQPSHMTIERTHGGLL